MANFTTESSALLNTTGNDYIALEIVNKAIALPLSLVIIGGNIVFLYILSKSSKSTVNKITKNHAVIDLIAGITLLLSFAFTPIYSKLPGNRTVLLCHVWSLLRILPIYQQFIFLLFLNVDRLLTVNLPATYPDSFKGKKIPLVCTVLWFYGITVSLVSMVTGGESTGENCDFDILSSLYLMIVLVVHLMPSILISSGIFIRLKFDLRVHQRKIQVSNTLTYANLVSDVALSKVFYGVTLGCFLIVIQFVIVIVLWHFNQLASHVHYAIRLSAIFAHFSHLKYLVFIAFIPEFRQKLKSMGRNKNKTFSSSRSSCTL